MMTSLLEYFERDCEITVFPQPNAPGIAVVPPCTHLHKEKRTLICKELKASSLPLYSMFSKKHLGFKSRATGVKLSVLGEKHRGISLNLETEGISYSFHLLPSKYMSYAGTTARLSGLNLWGFHSWKHCWNANTKKTAVHCKNRHCNFLGSKLHLLHPF